MRNILYEGYMGKRMPRELALERVRRVIREELTEVERETLTAFYFQEMKIIDIAKEQGVNKSTVSRNLRRAEEKLRRFLKY